MTAAAIARPRVLADLLPGALLRDILLVIGAAAFTGLCAQVSIPLPFTPVPITLQTFAVLLSGAALGPWRGGAAMLLYLVAGVAGVPWFAGQESGYSGDVVFTFGYIIGFVVAATVVGALASRGADRTVSGTLAIMVLGNLIIYAFGVPWLMATAGMPLFLALENGLWPFVIGDALKIALAAGLLPLAWRLAGKNPPASG
ncbi:MAG TPA: biotin transporter BioY [Candidatus Limnocylindria bacterium]|jgi:biotin transport system substrate-specific component